MSDRADDTPLGEVTRTWFGGYLERVQGIVERSRHLVRSGLDLLRSIEIQVDSRRHIVTASLWARCLEHYEAVIVLAGKGLNVPAEVALRALIEVLLTLAAVVKDNDVLESYIKEDFVHRRNLTRKLRQVQDPAFARHVDPALEAELDRMIQETGARKLTLEFLAHKADMIEWYLIVYPLLSVAAHTKVRDLERYLTTKNAELLGFSFKRCDAELMGTFTTAGLAFILASDQVEAVFGRGFGEDRKVFFDYFLDLGRRVAEAHKEEGV